MLVGDWTRGSSTLLDPQRCEQLPQRTETVRLCFLHHLGQRRVLVLCHRLRHLLCEACGEGEIGPGGGGATLLSLLPLAVPVLVPGGLPLPESLLLGRVRVGAGLPGVCGARAGTLLPQLVRAQTILTFPLSGPLVRPGLASFVSASSSGPGLGDEGLDGLDLVGVHLLLLLQGGEEGLEVVGLTGLVGAVANVGLVVGLPGMLELLDGGLGELEVLLGIGTLGVELQVDRYDLGLCVVEVGLPEEQDGQTRLGSLLSS